MTSRVPHTIKYKVDTATQETILDLRLKRFGCNRIRFRPKRLGVYLSSRTIYKILKSPDPNDMVQMNILGPFYIHQSSAKNYIISCIDTGQFDYESFIVGFADEPNKLD